MLLTSTPILQFKSLSLTTPFLHGTTTTTTAPLFRRATSSAAAPPPPASVLPVIRAMRTLQGKVVCATNDKTVAVEVVRLAPHPKYKRRVRKKKKYQAHDPLNQFNVGDTVQLEKGRPISKNKTFWAVPVPARTASKPKSEAAAPPPQDLGIPLESQLNQDCLDEPHEFYYGSKDDDEEQERYDDDKWWIRVPKVPKYGLSENGCSESSAEMGIPESLHWSSCSCHSIQDLLTMSMHTHFHCRMGDSIYKMITEDLLSSSDLSSEHETVDLKNEIEASVVIWKRKINATDTKCSWGSGVSMEKRDTTGFHGLERMPTMRMQMQRCKYTPIV